MPKWLEIFLEVAVVIVVGFLFVTFCTPFGEAIQSTLNGWLDSIKTAIGALI